MASILSAEASAQAHLHLDPSLQIPVKSKFEDCCPGSTIFFKFFCCGCFKSDCCNKTTLSIESAPIYCHANGLCEVLVPDAHENVNEALQVTAIRVKGFVEKDKRLSMVHRESGIDLEERVAKAEPISVRELKRMQTL